MAEQKTPVLETRKLGISFGGLKAVQDFNLQMYQGELVGLIGPNGAGKTTVFNLLTGVYVPTEGTVLLDGTPLNGKKTHQFVAAGIARTFQNIRLFGDMTVLENVKVAFSKDIHYGLLDAIFRTPVLEDRGVPDGEGNGPAVHLPPGGQGGLAGLQFALRPAAQAGDCPGPGHQHEGAAAG